MTRFAGRTALITGGARGIGRATGRRLAAEGATVIILDRDPEAAAATAVALGEPGAAVSFVVADITDEASVGAAIDQVRKTATKLDILVNNAARATSNNLADTTPENWQADVDGTLKGAFLMTHAALPLLIAAGGHGAIVNIGSVNGLTTLGNPAYSAGKAGLLSFTKALAVEYGPKGVRTNMVSPGTVQTDNPSWRRRLERDPAIFERLARWYPLGRVGQPDDIAAAVAFLAADEAGFVNGANLVVDGGLTAGIAPMIRELTADPD